MGIKNNNWCGWINKNVIKQLFVGSNNWKTKIWKS